MLSSSRLKEPQFCRILYEKSHKFANKTVSKREKKMSASAEAMETAQLDSEQPVMKCERLPSPKEATANGIYRTFSVSHTSKMKQELERWKTLMLEKTIDDVPVKAEIQSNPIDEGLTQDQKFFVGARANGSKFMQESLDFRKKFLFYIQVLSAAAERADDERNDESNEFQGTHKDNLLGRIVIHEPYMSTNSTE